MFSFEVNRPKDISAMFNDLKNEARKNNLSFSGDETAGRASGFGFEGRYTVLPNAIKIDVLKKPLIISQKTIIEKTKEYLSKYY